MLKTTHLKLFGVTRLICIYQKKERAEPTTVTSRTAQYLTWNGGRASISSGDIRRSAGSKNGGRPLTHGRGPRGANVYRNYPKLGWILDVEHAGPT